MANSTMDLERLLEEPEVLEGEAVEEQSFPKTRIEPLVFLARPTIALIVVVLPAPFGPRKPKNSPAGMRSETSSTAVKSP